MKKRNKYILAAVAVVIGLLILWSIFWPSTVTVETAKAVQGEIAVTVDAEGKTRFRDKYTVAAPISGRMKRINLRECDTVPRGYVITEIDPNPPTPRPPQEADGSINPYASKVYSPAAGRVLQIFEKNERMIAAGTPIIEIGNPGPVELVIDVLSTQAAGITPGTNVLIDNETGPEPIKARVRAVEPQAITKTSALGVEERRVNVIADLMTKGVKFGDNFRVDAHIIVWQQDNVLKIPSSALFRNGDQWNVFVVDDGTGARPRRFEDIQPG